MRTGPGRIRALEVGLLLCLGLSPRVEAKVFHTVEEALRLYLPDCDVQASTVYLTRGQLSEVRRLAGVEVPGALVRPYVATRGDTLVGTVYFDTHLVRTLPEVLMLIVDPNGRVERVEVLSFQEPEEYMPRSGWYGQFRDRGLDSELALKRGIAAVTGATLTARATTNAVRRILAVHQVLRGATTPDVGSEPMRGDHLEGAEQSKSEESQ